MTRAPRTRFPAAPLLTAVLAAAVAAPLPALAQPSGAKAKSPFSFELETGYRYNSRLAVPDLDILSASGSHGYLFKAGAELDVDLSDRTGFSAGYRFSQVSYSDLGTFDTRTHLGSLGIKHDFGPVDAGLNYHHANSELDGRDYLEVRRLSPHISGYLSERVMLRGTYVHSEKEFDRAPGRDATVQGAGGDAFFFLDGAKTYLSAGYLREQNDARAAEFDFDADVFSARLAHKFGIGGVDARVRLGYQHENRDYNAVTPSISAVRGDTRDSFNAEFRVDFSDWLFAALEHEINDFSSNLPAADYSQNVSTLLVGLRF